mmetsp:Transcript_17774/g.42291  ORF Transcript_17774/g.42291 Transcript_17774/m.42291 type:complete len:432 (-) Transcript_17774:317-1612(-)
MRFDVHDLPHTDIKTRHRVLCRCPRGPPLLRGLGVGLGLARGLEVAALLALGLSCGGGPGGGERVLALGGVRETSQRLLTTKPFQHRKERRRSRRPRRSGAQWLRKLGQLASLGVDVRAHSSLKRLGCPVPDTLNHRDDLSQAGLAFLVQTLGCPSVEGERALRKEEHAGLGDVCELLCSWFEVGHGSLQLLCAAWGDGAQLHLREPHGHLRQLPVRHLLEVLLVQVVQLVEVETRRRTTCPGHREDLDGVLSGDLLRIAVSPAQAQEVVAHRGGEVAHVPVLLRSSRPVTLGELLAVSTVDERDVGKAWRNPTSRDVQLILSEGVGEMVGATDDVRNTHVMVVDHHGEHVSWGSVRTKKDHVVHLAVSHGDVALHLVVDHRLPLQGHLESDNGINSRRCLGRVSVAPTTVVPRRLPLCLLLLAHRIQLLR